MAHYAKAIVLHKRKQFDDEQQELRIAIEDDPNLVAAYALYGGMHIHLGRAAETIPYEEAALRLSPRDPQRNIFEYWMCHAYAHMTQWEKAVEWCRKSIATNSSFGKCILTSSPPMDGSATKGAPRRRLKVYIS